MAESIDIVDICETDDIEFIRLFFVDTSGIIRGRAVSTARIESVLDGSITCPRNVLSMDFTDRYASDGAYGPDAEFQLEPVVETFTRLPYAPEAALLLCELIAPDGTSVPACGRSTLRSFLDDVEYETVAAFESECYLFDGEDRKRRFERKPLFSADGIHRTGEFAVELKRALREQGIHLDAYYPEGGAGQLEVVTRHNSALAAADDHLKKRRTVKAVAANAGYGATFAPMVAPDSSPAGLHLNVSVWDGDENRFHSETPDPGYQDGLSDPARHFVGGILDHASGLCALTAPLALSYRRMQLHDLAADRATWGTGDRRCMVRIPLTDNSPDATRIEYRLADNTANPYLALLGVLAAGFDGMERELDPGPQRDQHSESEAERLPSTLAQALDALESDGTLLEALGDELVETYLAVKREHIAGQAGETTSQNRIDTYVQMY